MLLLILKQFIITYNYDFVHGNIHFLKLEQIFNAGFMALSELERKTILHQHKWENV